MRAVSRLVLELVAVSTGGNIMSLISPNAWVNLKKLETAQQVSIVRDCTTGFNS